MLLADSFAPIANPVFGASADARSTASEAWLGALAYTLQIYFDFSGYSDMAVGLCLLFGIRLPFNFNSPYKARNIIDFWRRWHMTLSRFLRDYLYIPLGGNRHGRARRYVNLMLTMLLGGLWHGAGWTFVIWGGLHGVYLVVNHGWQCLREKMRWQRGRAWRARARGASVALTLLCVMVGWVFFRAPDIASAQGILASMFGLRACGLPFPRWPVIRRASGMDRRVLADRAVWPELTGAHRRQSHRWLDRRSEGTRYAELLARDGGRVVRRRGAHGDRRGIAHSDRIHLLQFLTTMKPSRHSSVEHRPGGGHGGHAPAARGGAAPAAGVERHVCRRSASDLADAHHDPQLELHVLDRLEPA